MQIPPFNPFMNSLASYSPRLHQPSICISNDTHSRPGWSSPPAARSWGIGAPGQSQTPQDLEHFPAESHHPRSISWPGRDLLFISGSSSQQKRLRDSSPKWNKQGRRGDITSQTLIPGTGSFLAGKSPEVKSEGLGKPLLSSWASEGDDVLGGSPGRCRPRAETPTGSPKQPCPCASTALPMAREVSALKHWIGSSNDFQKITWVQTSRPAHLSQHRGTATAARATHIFLAICDGQRGCEMAEEEGRVTPEPGGDRAGRRRLSQVTMALAAQPYPKTAATGAAGASTLQGTCR